MSVQIVLAFVITVTKIPGINNLREEGLILAQGFRGFCPQLPGPLCLVTHNGNRSMWWRSFFTCGGQDAEAGRDLQTWFNLQRHTFSDPLPLTRQKVQPSQKSVHILNPSMDETIH
jgi:hypothetical protein